MVLGGYMADKITIQVKKTDGSLVRMTMDEFRVYKKQGAQNMEKGMRDEGRGTSLLMQAEKEGKTEKTKRVVSIPLYTGKFGAAVEQKRVENSAPQLRSTNQKEKYDDKVTDQELPKKKSIPLHKAQDLVVTKSPTGSLPAVETPHDLSTTTPVIGIFKDEARASTEWHVDDYRSLLEDNNKETVVPSAVAEQPMAQVKDDNDFLSLLLQKISVHVPPDLQDRLKAILLSWRKGIRDKNQVYEYVTRPVEKGGIGLSIVDAQNLCNQLQGEKKQLSSLRRTLKLNSKEQVVTRNIAPESRAEKDASVSEGRVSQSSVYPSIASSKFGRQQVIHDVVPSIQKEEKKAMGPEDEMAAFTLIDFRRLASDPQASAAQLLAKYENWKKESYVWYMDICRAWYRSPLYQEYARLTTETLISGVSIREALLQKGRGTMTYEEYLAIVSMNKHLDI